MTGDDAPVVRGYGSGEPPPVPLHTAVLVFLVVVSVLAIGTCGDIEQPGGPDQTVEVRW